MRGGAVRGGGDLVLVPLAEQRDDLDHAHHADEAQDAADARAGLEALRDAGEVTLLHSALHGALHGAFHNGSPAWCIT